MEKLKISVLAALLLTGAQAFAWHYPEPGNQELPFDKGEGTQELPYQITNAQQLAVLAYLVNNGASYEGQYFVLENDIDLNEGITFTADGPDKMAPWNGFQSALEIESLPSWDISTVRDTQSAAYT